MTSTPRPRLTVDLSALQENYNALSALRPEAETAAVVKANAYGLGAVQVVTALHGARCRTFFTAYTFEAVALKNALPALFEDSTLCVFNGPATDDLAAYTELNLTPVLNTLDQVEMWRDRQDPCMLHVDTGMNRLGLTRDEVSKITRNEDRYSGMAVSHIISHFACSADPSSEMNKLQVGRFGKLLEELTGVFPDTKCSISASGGIFLPFDLTENLTRPGVALYGASPQEHQLADLRPAAKLEAPVLQVRTLAPGDTIGYGATYTAKKPTTVATLGIGYGDGYPRHMSNSGLVRIHDTRCPVIGMVSMDLTTVDVSDCPRPVKPGDMAECFGDMLPIEEVAVLGDTIAYELIVTLGDRIERVYVT